MDIAPFRAAFPEFTDTTRYPDTQITFWSTLAEAQVRQCVWKSLWTLGVQLYTAHEITLAAQNVSVAAYGGNPVGIPGPVNSKAVGQVNEAFDTQSTAEKDAGWWNMTNYGKMFINLARILGTGGVQL